MSNGIALTGCLISVLIFNVFYNAHWMLQFTETGLQFTTNSLTNLKSYVEEKRMEMINKNIMEDNRQRKVFSSQTQEICPPFSYRTRIIHRNPLIIYIENMLTEKERNHLIALA